MLLRAVKAYFRPSNGPIGRRSLYGSTNKMECVMDKFLGFCSKKNLVVQFHSVTLCPLVRASLLSWLETLSLQDTIKLEMMHLLSPVVGITHPLVYLVYGCHLCSHVDLLSMISTFIWKPCFLSFLKCKNMWRLSHKQNANFTVCALLFVT